MELLIVMAIIAMLAGYVGVNMIKHVGTSKQTVAKAQIDTFGTALDMFRLGVGRYPTTSEGLQALRTNPGADLWNGPYLAKRSPCGPVGKTLYLRMPRTAWRL